MKDNSAEKEKNTNRKVLHPRWGPIIMPHLVHRIKKHYERQREKERIRKELENATEK